MKKMLIGMDSSNKNKITVNGCPRVIDFISKKKKQKNYKFIIFVIHSYSRISTT